MRISEIVKVTKGKLVSGSAETDIDLSTISTDSRTISPGEFFLPIKGDNFDGEKFIEEAFKKGAVGAFTTQYAVRSTQYGIYHVSNSGKVSWYEYAREILRLTRSRTEVFPISSEELSRPARRPAMSVLDNSKIARFTDYRMRRWQGALKEYLSAFAEYHGC